MTVYTIKTKSELKDYSSECIIKFSAKWCGPCKAISPYYHDLAKKYDDIFFLEVDTEVSPDISDKYNINSLPTFVALKNSREIGRVVGASKDKLKDLVCTF